MDSISEGAVAILRREGRASFADIARRLGTSRSSVAKRINPLLDSGQLQIISAVHPHLLHRRVIAHLSIRQRGDLAALVSQILTQQTPVYITEVTGTHQLVVELQCRSMTELHEEIGVVRALSGVIDVEVLIYDRVLRGFFQIEPPTIQPAELDAVDYAIMNVLARDGRAGFAEISEAVGLSGSGCRNRVSRLLSTGAVHVGAVRGFAARDESLVFGIGFCVAGNREPLLELLHAERGIEFLASAVGRFDIIGTVAVPNLPAFIDLMTRIRALPKVLATEQWLHVGLRHERYPAPPTRTEPAVEREVAQRTGMPGG